jgi:GABA(A) receptor-associated protein
MTSRLQGIFRTSSPGTKWPEFTLEMHRRIVEKHPGRIPVLLAKHPSSVDLPDLQKQKFLVPSDLSLGQFVYVVRKNLTLPPEKALFLFVGNTLQPSSVLMNELYHHYRSENGALQMIYTSEATFGG